MRKLQLSDLSVGDWVKASLDGNPENKQPMRVKGLGNTAGGYVYTDAVTELGCHAEFEPYEVEGVVLTQEILESNGFQKKSEFYTRYDAIQAALEIETPVDLVESWRWEFDEVILYPEEHRRGWKLVTTGGTRPYDLVMIVFCVHELQRAMRLMGYEENIKL